MLTSHNIKTTLLIICFEQTGPGHKTSEGIHWCPGMSRFSVVLDKPPSNIQGRGLFSCQLLYCNDRINVIKWPVSFSKTVPDHHFIQICCLMVQQRGKHRRMFLNTDYWVHWFWYVCKTGHNSAIDIPELLNKPKHVSLPAAWISSSCNLISGFCLKTVSAGSTGQITYFSTV